MDNDQSREELMGVVLEGQVVFQDEDDRVLPTDVGQEMEVEKKAEDDLAQANRLRIAARRRRRKRRFLRSEVILEIANYQRRILNSLEQIALRRGSGGGIRGDGENRGGGVHRGGSGHRGLGGHRGGGVHRGGSVHRGGGVHRGRSGSRGRGVYGEGSEHRGLCGHRGGGGHRGEGRHRGGSGNRGGSGHLEEADTVVVTVEDAE